jgi:hypothetical protein
MDPVDEIWLGKTFRKTDWLLAGYKKLVTREAPISEKEGEKLGLNTVIRLFQLRESAKAKGNGSRRQSTDKIRLAIAQELPAGTPTFTWASTDISLSSEWAHHGRFYMENIIFLVRRCLDFSFLGH